MRMFLAALGGSTGAVAAGAVAVVLIGAGIYYQSTRNAALPPEETPVVAVPDSAEPAQSAAATPPAAAPAPSDEPEQTQAAAQPPNAPSFDEVRRDEDGVTVIAGQARPGAKVAILQNGAEIASVAADGQGKFATIAMIPLDGQGHVLSLLEQGEGAQIPSEDEIILAPLSAPAPVAEAEPEAVEEPVAPQVAALAPEAAEPPMEEQQAPVADVGPEPADAEAAEVEPAPQPANELDPQQTADATVPPAEQTPAIAQSEAADEASGAPQVAEAEEAPAQTVQTAEAPTELAQPAPEQTAEDPAAQQSAEAAPAPETPTAANETTTAAAEEAEEVPRQQQAAVLKSTSDGVELLSSAAPEVMDTVALDTISYSAQGDVQLSGRAQSAATAVRVYLDNAPVANLDVDAAGRWRGDLPNVDEGIYTLRVDEVAADGQVTSRVETPFKREAPAVLAAATAEQAGPISAVTVQQGATLWAIARERYGDPLLYVRIFEANREAIRDPDLIYPGQIFDLPD